MKNKLQWLKAIAFVGVLMCAQLAFATDTTDIPELNTPASAGMSVIKFICKWGGIAVIAGVFLAIGSGKAKGDMAPQLCALGFMVGGLAAAFGWFSSTGFTAGFAF